MPHITARSQGVATLVKLHRRLQSQLLLLFAIVMGRWPRHPEYELRCLWRLPVHQSSWGGLDASLAGGLNPQNLSKRGFG